MKQTHSIGLTIEKTETLIVRRRRRIAFVWCDGCGRKVEMFAPEEAAIIARTSPRKIYQAIEAGRIHFIELPEGLLLVCVDSLCNTDLGL